MGTPRAAGAFHLPLDAVCSVTVCDVSSQGAWCACTRVRGRAAAPDGPGADREGRTPGLAKWLAFASQVSRGLGRGSSLPRLCGVCLRLPWGTSGEHTPAALNAPGTHEYECARSADRADALSGASDEASPSPRSRRRSSGRCGGGLWQRQRVGNGGGGPFILRKNGAVINGAPPSPPQKNLSRATKYWNIIVFSPFH